ncbi:hypothetical protein [Cognatishimia sp.]|uniref:hypothetical protein n=1 Tax=Cognatishimia sp. TaxID=2211648 RepID=UPI003517BC04|nr:hypothetical protein [Cognatishimia sp.]
MTKNLEKYTGKQKSQKEGLLLTQAVSAGVDIPMEVAEELIEKMIARPTLFSLMEVYPVRNPKETRITKTLMQDWVLYVKDENTAPQESEYSKSNLSYIDIQPKKISAATYLTHEILTDIAVGGGKISRAHEKQLIQTLTNNWLDIAVNADPAFVDAGNAQRQEVMRLFNGFLLDAANNPKTELVNPVDDTTDPFNSTALKIFDILDEMQNTLPNEYLQVSGDFAYIMNKKDYNRFRSAIRKDRQTAAGDIFLFGNVEAFNYNGIPVIGDVFIPENTILLTMPKNMMWCPRIGDGDMRIVKDYSARQDRYETYIHTEADITWQELDAVVYQQLGLTP